MTFGVTDTGSRVLEASRDRSTGDPGVSGVLHGLKTSTVTSLSSEMVVMESLKVEYTIVGLVGGSLWAGPTVPPRPKQSSTDTSHLLQFKQNIAKLSYLLSCRAL